MDDQFAIDDLKEVSGFAGDCGEREGCGEYFDYAVWVGDLEVDLFGGFGCGFCFSEARGW